MGCTFAAVARDQLPVQIKPDTLQTVQARINENIQRLAHRAVRVALGRHGPPPTSLLTG